MAKKIRYYYDEENCTFLPERVTVKSVFIKVTSFFLGSTLIACLLLATFFLMDYNPEEAALMKRNATLTTKIRDLEGQFAQLEQDVDNLHSQDNEFYRSLLNTDKIDDGYWKGGKGGSVQIEQGSQQDEVLRDAADRLERLNYKMDIQSKSYDVLFKLLKDKEEELKHIPAIKPVQGDIVSGFGMRMHPIHKIRKMHTGLDMRASTGTPVYAAGDGIVKLAGTSRGGYGKQIELDHGGYGYVTKYAHLSEILVTKGQKIERGDVIGLSGNTGLSKGPHLHYEIIKNGRRINPIDYFYGDLTPQEYVKLRDEAKVENMSLD
ncbi:MAG: peptidoglycan DD-metalloendopeptidase family protein [Bacteroidota bacterium]